MNMIMFALSFVKVKMYVKFNLKILKKIFWEGLGNSGFGLKYKWSAVLV